MAADAGTSWGEILRPTWRLIQFDRRELGILLVYTLALGMITATVPFVSQILVNQAAFTGTAPPIVILAVVVLGVLLIGAVIRLFQIRVSALIAKRLFVRTALVGTSALLHAPAGKYEFDDREVANRFFDIMNFQVRFSVLVSEGLGVLVFSLLGIVLLAFYHPLFLAFSLLLVLACIAVIVPFAKAGVRRSYDRSTEKYRVAFWLSQVAEHRSLLRQSHDQKPLYGRTDKLASQYVRAYFEYMNLLLFQSGTIFVIQAIASAAFFGLGGWLVVRGQLNLGQLVAAEIVLIAVVGALGRFNFYLDSFYEMVVAARKVSDLTEASEPEAAQASLPQEVHGIEISSPLLAETLHLKPGDVVALRGDKRSECSHLLREIASEASPDVDVRWDCDQYVERAAGVHLILFMSRAAVLHMTLAENLALVSDETTLEAARSKVLDVPLLNARERVMADQQLSSIDFGITDRSRYAVARAFMSDRPLVLIDMFFNLMDLTEQVEFVREFKRRFPNKILIINSFDGAIDPYVTRVVKVTGASR